MPIVHPYLKKTFKVILWIFISLLLLFTTLAVLIQVPAIQNKIVQYATSYISDKTHTKVELKKISIVFPKLILIEGLYLEDLQQDTLLYAGKAEINIAFGDLFRRRIHISSFALEDVNLNLSRTENDSLYNFNFLVTAFGDSTKVEETKPKEPSKWTFGLDDVRLKNIRLHYDDAYGGTDMRANLSQLHLTMDELDLAQSIFRIDELEVDRLTASVLLLKSEQTTDTTTSDNPPPKLSANKIRIRNTSFRFGDSVNKQTLFAGITQLQLKDAAVNLEKQTVGADEVSLAKSKVQYSRSDLPLDSAVVVVNEAVEKNNWTVAVKNIHLVDNSLAYHVPNRPRAKKVFDAAHMDYRHVSLKAKDFSYSPEKTAVVVKKLSSVDQNGFAVLKFETEFVMDEHSITTKNSKLKTSGSSMDADLGMRYSSLAALKDSLPYMIVNADMHKMRVLTSEVLYFVPQLATQDFFKNKTNITTVSGKISGPINKLQGEKMVVQTGELTLVETDFVITGLPDAKTAYFNFPNLKVYSGKKDIQMMAGTSIPKSIDLPENLSMLVVFKGQLKSFESTMGMSSSFGSANLFARLDAKENFSSKVRVNHFDLGRLLKNREMFGPVTLSAETSGQGLDKNTIKAKIKADVTEIFLNKYMYHKLTVDGAVAGQMFEGKINLDDKNAVFDFSGLVNLNKGQEQYKFNLNLKAADLQKLHITNDDIRIALMAESDLKGGSVKTINGKAGITKIFIAHEEKKYLLDSVLFASINEANKSEFSLNSALVGLKYNGTFSPFDLATELKIFMNNYFPISEPKKTKEQRNPQNFTFEVQLHNHPILSEVFVPELKEFEPGLISGSFDSEKKELKLNAAMRRIVYGSMEMNNLALVVNSDANALNYSFTSSSLASGDYKLDNIVLDGTLANDQLTAGISSIDEDKNQKLRVRSFLTKEQDDYKLVLDTANFVLMNNRWDIAGDNYIAFGKKGFLIHHLLINKAESEILIASVHDRFNDDLNVEIKNFQLNDLSRIIEKDTSLVKGIVNGNVLFKRVDSTYGLVADAKISNMVVREVPVGELTIKAVNPTAQKFDVEIGLAGAENNLTVKGYFVPKGGDQALHVQADIQSLSLKTVEAFSMGQITEGSGSISGHFLVEGKVATPDITGELTFNNAGMRPKVLNNHLLLKNETVQLKKDGIYFNSFTITDPEQHTAVINGAVKMEHFKNFLFDLSIDTREFLLFNTSAKDNEQFYGRMIIDSKIDVTGPMTLPVVNARVKMRKGSNFTFAVPEKKLTTDKGEGIVEFEDSIKLNPILVIDKKKATQSSGITGFDISSIIEIDKEATLRLMLDPASTDSLVVKGDAAMSFAIDRSGKMTLTGAYHLNDGSYLVSLESVIKRKFDISPGSTIIWNGDPLDADININAVYSVRASPIDLVADQMAGLSENDRSGYKQRFPFLVLLKLRGELLHPQISFEIQLPPEEKGILGGAVNAKLNLLNDDPSALNKQVFALLVLGRFVQENPLQTETNAAAAAARTTVGKFLSAQLNQLSSKVVPGVELNFDVQSYDDYQSGEAEGRTEVDIGVKKQLFDERLSVQVGGSVDVEGERAKQNSTSDITSDVTLEYKMTKDGRYRLKAFRHNKYESIEGQLVETGAGVLYVRDFDGWKDFFRKPKKKKAVLKGNNEATTTK